MRNLIKLLALSLSVVGLLSGCAVHNAKMWEPAKFPKATPATNKLQSLPPAGQKVAIAVYGFTDQTGQFKPTDGAQTLSRAVTQGATSILVKSLHEAGRRSWFTVIEREKLDNVLRERAVIREMRASYLGEKKINPQALPPLLFAGVLLEGGIIGYDSNTKSGGSGARFLGIGGQTQYREDTVTVYLRAVSVKTGEVLSSVSMRKSIASIGVGASAFRYVAFKELLELESGVSYNEPDQLALQQTIEAAIYALIMEGAMQDLWCFNTSSEKATALMRSYLSDRDSLGEAKVQLAVQSNGQPLNGACQTAKTARVRPATSNQLVLQRPVKSSALRTSSPLVPAAAPVVKAVRLQSIVAKPKVAPPAAFKPAPRPAASASTAKTSVPQGNIASPSKVVPAKVATVVAKLTTQSESPAALTKVKRAPAVMEESAATDTPAEECVTIMVSKDQLPEGYVPSVPDPNGCKKMPKYQKTVTASVESWLNKLEAEAVAAPSVAKTQQTEIFRKSVTASLQGGVNME